MLKKQSFMSMTASFHVRGNMEGEGRPGYKGPISSMASLIFLKSWRSLHLSLPGFRKTNIGEFQGLFVGAMWPLATWSSMRASSTLNFSLFRGHWSTHIWESVFQFRGGVAHLSAAPTRSPGEMETMGFLVQSLIEIISPNPTK